jgi:hypothetical protein
MSHDLAEKLGKHSRGLIACSHETRAKVRSSDEEVPLTHGRGVFGSGNFSHSRPARLPARCGQARSLISCAFPINYNKEATRSNYNRENERYRRDLED